MKLIIHLIIVLLLPVICIAQKADSSLNNIEKLPDKYFSSVNNKLNLFTKRLTKKSDQYLSHSEKCEKKILRKLRKTNPKQADSLAAIMSGKYKDINAQLKTSNSKHSTTYSSYLDTLHGSLSFLSKNKELAGKAQESLKSLTDLQGKLQSSQKVQDFLKERKAQMSQVLAKYNLSAALKKQYQKLNKTAYYYESQVQEYKKMLKDPDKMEKKALALLRNVPAFQNFMKKNSQLAMMFPNPSGTGSLASLNGLQTIQSVNALIRKQMGNATPAVLQQLQQNIADAKGQLGQLKNKINGLGGGNSDLTIPDFKPNKQKTKTFMQRLEYGFDVHFGKKIKYLPGGSEFGGTVGYKLNDKSIVGIGASYKMSFGTIQHIQFRSESVGLRSYLEYKIKKQFFMRGGFEMNYNTAFQSIAELKNLSAWQSSALLGLSKKYKISKKLKGNLQILYDFLSNKHVPATEPFVFRVGYNF